MTGNLLDLSGKIDPETIAILEEISRIASDLEVPFYIIGARARDFVLQHGYGISTARLTVDIDLGIQVSDWDQFNDLKNGLVETSEFRNTKQPQRIIHSSGIPVDIIPFGDIADEKDLYGWLAEQGFTMNVLGFDETFAHSLIGTFRRNPILKIRLASPVGLAILKIIAWSDERTERAKDAQDLYLLMKNHIDAGNLQRFYDQIDSFSGYDEGFDYECASARLLGRDIGSIGKEATIKTILDVLDRETNTKGRLLLITAIQTGTSFPDDFDTILRLLKHLRAGILDVGV